MTTPNKYNWRDKPTLVSPNVAKGFKEWKQTERQAQGRGPESKRPEKRRLARKAAKLTKLEEKYNGRQRNRVQAKAD